jgi:salicylate hydroxylase
MLLNLYGPSTHLICYPVSPTRTCWAMTQRSSTAEHETWQYLSPEKLSTFRTNLLSQFQSWKSPLPELIASAERIIKYGLYDRPHLEPEQWYSKGGRAILIGDAAHPTSPHLGQGANQALEDCYHLARLLPDFSPDSEAKPSRSHYSHKWINNGVVNGEHGSQGIGREVLKGIFDEFARLRQPRTKDLVRAARMQGEMRVVDGDEATQERDEILRRALGDQELLRSKWDGLLGEPF